MNFALNIVRTLALQIGAQDVLGPLRFRPSQSARKYLARFPALTLRAGEVPRSAPPNRRQVVVAELTPKP